MKRVRRFISKVEEAALHVGEALGNQKLSLRVDRHGVIYIEIDGVVVESEHNWKMPVAKEVVIDLLSVFEPDSYTLGPNLVAPSPHLRIVPGKLTGEPHVRDTRIETRALVALVRRNMPRSTILDLYPGLSREALDESVALEDQLERNLRAA